MFNMDFDDSAFWQEPDFLLADLVSSMANRSGMQLGVTLMIKGTVVTGTLISERDYLAAMSDMFVAQAKKSIPSPTKEDLKAVSEAFDFNMLTEEDYDSDSEDDSDEDDGGGLSPIRHLHLKDPAILLPQPSIAFAQGEFSVMRIRLTSVDGWMIGRSTVIDTDTPPEILH